MVPAVIAKAGTKLSNATGRAGLVLKKKSPEILLGVGIVGMIGTVVLAVRADRKVRTVKEDYDELIEDIREAEYEDEKERGRDLTHTYIQRGVAYTKEYAPAVTTGVVSITCILASNHIIQKRYAGVVAAYKVTESAFKEYRRRVIEEMGEDADLYFRHGVRKEQITEEEVDPETGKKRKVKKDILSVDGSKMPSQYARFYDETCRSWKKSAEANLLFLRGVQSEMNDMLRLRGHVFLNEVYDALDIPRTAEGAVVGWTISKTGDNYIDFGIWDVNQGPARAFVNGLEPTILLDFNVDGVIYDKI